MWKRLLERWLGWLTPAASASDPVSPGEEPQRLLEELQQLSADRRRLLQTLEYYRSFGLNTLVRESETALQQTDRRYRALKSRLQHEPRQPEARTEPS